MGIDIRRATRDQSNVLTTIAHAAKRHWGYPERWIDAWKDVLTITADYISTNEVYVAMEGEEAVGFYAVVRGGEDGRVVLDHMWVLPGHIGAGVGREMFNHSAETALSLSATDLEIESDPNAEGFYLRMGARRAGEVVSELEGKPRSLPRLVFEIKPSGY